MARLLALFALGFVLFLVSRKTARLSASRRRRAVYGALIAVPVAALAVLIVTGRVHWLAAALAPLLVVLRTLARLLLTSPALIQWLARLRGPRDGHRSRAESNGGRGRSTSGRGPAAMTRQQALAVLGVAEGATREEILAAHRGLIQKVHPDTGGSDYLAAEINRARDVLLGRR